MNEDYKVMYLTEVMNRRHLDCLIADIAIKLNKATNDCQDSYAVGQLEQILLEVVDAMNA